MISKHSTLQSSSDPGEGAPSAVLALTILAHPDTARLGDQALGWQALRLSRTEPDFAGRPLEDRHVSREALHIRKQGGRVHLQGGGGLVRLEGRPLGEEAVVGALDLRIGVVVSLGSKVHLLLREGAEPSGLLPEVLGPSPELEAARRRLSGRPARHSLLLGPPGVGKTSLALSLHAEGPLVHLHAASPRLDLAALRSADGGLLIVEDIEVAPPALQAALVALVETRSVGGAELRARLVCTSRAASPRLLPGLGDRLLRVELPPLCQRREDIAAQLRAFQAERLRARGMPERMAGWLRPAQSLELMGRPWAGNTRELEELVQQMVDLHAEADQPSLEPLTPAGPPLPSSTAPPTAEAGRLPPMAFPSLVVADQALLDRLRYAVALHLGEPGYGVEELAREVGQSPRHLHRTVLRITGRPPVDLLRAMKMEEARRLLRSGTFSTVSEVAAAVGLSRTHFFRVYAATFGCSPSEDLGRDIVGRP